MNNLFNDLRNVLKEMEPVHGQRPLITLSVSEWLVIMDAVADRDAERSKKFKGMMAQMDAYDYAAVQKSLAASYAQRHSPPITKLTLEESVSNLEIEHAKVDRLMRRIGMGIFAALCLLYAYAIIGVAL